MNNFMNGLFDDDEENPLLKGDSGLLGPGPVRVTAPGVPMPPVAPNISAASPTLSASPHAIPNMPPAQAAPGAQLAPPPQNFWGRVHDTMQNLLTGDAPQGFEGVLTPEEIARAKPGIMGAIFGGGKGSPNQDWADNLSALVQRKMGVQQIQQAAKLQKGREQIQASLGPPPTDPAGFDQWVRKAYGAYESIGDHEMLKNLGAIVEKAQAAHPDKFQAVQAGDYVYTFDPASGLYTKGPQRGVPAAKLQEDADNREIRKLSIANQMNEFQLRQGQTQARMFQNQNADLAKTDAQYDNAKGAIAAARTSPEATKSALLAFMRFMDPGAQLRMGTISFLKNVDPSFLGSLQQKLSTGFSGKLPPNQLDQMEKLIDSQHANHRSTYEQRYQALVKRMPGAQVFATPTSDLFDNWAASGGVAGPATPASRARSVIGTP